MGVKTRNETKNLANNIEFYSKISIMSIITLKKKWKSKQNLSEYMISNKKSPMSYQIYHNQLASKHDFTPYKDHNDLRFNRIDKKSPEKRIIET